MRRRQEAAATGGGGICTITFYLLKIILSDPFLYSEDYITRLCLSLFVVTLVVALFIVLVAPLVAALIDVCACRTISVPSSPMKTGTRET